VRTHIRLEQAPPGAWYRDYDRAALCPYFERKAIRLPNGRIIKGKPGVTHRSLSPDSGGFERGFIGWDGVYYSMEEMNDLVEKWIYVNGYAGPEAKVILVAKPINRRSEVAQFHSL
jgi:hypothetical protein